MHSAVLQDPSQAFTTVGEFFTDGGILMWPILGCSIVVVGLSIERYLSLRLPRLLPTSVADAVQKVRQGGAAGVATGVEATKAPAARVLAAALRRRGFEVHDVEKAMEDQIYKEASRLRTNVRGISLMASVAPLLGLLGTVLGIAQAFAVVEQAGLGKPEHLAAGIKVALYTTVFGLLVAIPATVLAAHLNSRVRRLLMVVGESLEPVVEHLASQAERDARAGDARVGDSRVGRG
jgi:biopolymer transport protein ExbB